MSGVLDDIILKDIEKHCPTAILNYQKCITRDHLNCGQEHQDLITCISKEVPSFQKIFQNCQEPMSAYERCLRSNGHIDKCSPELQDYRDCAFKVVN